LIKEKIRREKLQTWIETLQKIVEKKMDKKDE
jgi:hypothetical protein